MSDSQPKFSVATESAKRFMFYSHNPEPLATYAFETDTVAFDWNAIEDGAEDLNNPNRGFCKMLLAARKEGATPTATPA